MTFQKFYKDKFALVIDLRSNEELDKTGLGKKIVSTQNGILMKMKKTAHTGKPVKLTRAHLVISYRKDSYQRK